IPESIEMYPGTSGSTHGDKNETSPARNAAANETSVICAQSSAEIDLGRGASRQDVYLLRGPLSSHNCSDASTSACTEIASLPLKMALDSCRNVARPRLTVIPPPQPRPPDNTEAKTRQMTALPVANDKADAARPR